MTNNYMHASMSWDTIRREFEKVAKLSLANVIPLPKKLEK